jgi:hypothetical protein
LPVEADPLPDRDVCATVHSFRVGQMMVTTVREQWAAPEIPDKRFAINSRRCLRIQELVEDFLRCPVADP